MISRARRMILAAAIPLGMAAASFLPTAALPQSSLGSGASVSIGSGPHKGKYDFAPTQACVLTAFDDQPLGLSVVLNARDSSLAIDVPNLDEPHAHELRIVLVVAELSASGQATASTTYEIDTRPDAVLQPFQRAERAHRGTTGKATSSLMTQGAFTLFSFSGETAAGIKLSGEITCRKMP